MSTLRKSGVAEVPGCLCRLCYLLAARCQAFTPDDAPTRFVSSTDADAGQSKVIETRGNRSGSG